MQATDDEDRMSHIPSPISPLRAHMPPAPSSGSPRADEAGHSTFRESLRDVAARLSSGDAAMLSTIAAGARAPALDSSQLLVLQAQVYQYTQELDLAGRLVDRMTQAVKTTLQSQS